MVVIIVRAEREEFMNFDRFRDILKKEQIRLHEPMARHTTFGIGGPADCFLVPSSREELLRVCAVIREENMPFFILGGGANLLVRDKGIRGAVIFMGRLQHVRQEGCRVIAEAGAATARVARFAMEHGLSGMEFAGGIPGTIGGAAFMNAGAFGGDMSKIVESAVTCDAEGRVRTYRAGEMGYAYRHSFFMEHPGEILVELRLSLEPDDPKVIQKKMTEINESRHARQPVSSRSAGSTFKRPEGHFAGAMIEELGLKGYAVGDAAVSDVHAGFLINKGRATCADMLALIRDIQEKVRARYGVDLEPEVQIIGEE